MKSKFKRALAFTASLAMCGMTLLQFPTGTFTLPLPASAAEGDACTEIDCTGTFDANGFCTEGGTHYEPAADNDGVYEIANAGQLYWFMELVNSVEPDESGNRYADYDAVLTADITVNENVLNEDGTLAEGDFLEWFPISYYHDRDGDGSEEEVYYNGTFDGRGHTISGLYFDNEEQDFVGLFGQINSGAEICNVTVEDSYFKGKNYVGGICGYNYGEITGCQNDATVIGTEYVGGICAANGDLLNCCANFGTIEGEKYVGGILGHNSYTGNSNEVRNCFSAGSVSGSSYVGGVCGWNYNAHIVNCYFDCTIYDGDPISTEEYSTNEGAEGRTTEQCKSGEVAVLLGDGWGQELGVQDYPVPNGMPVYYGYKDCYSTQKTYNNVKKDSPSHDFVNGTCVHCGNTPGCVHPEYENGFCLACDLYEPATDVDNDGVYEIANAGQLYWFMELVNGSGQNTVDIDAVLTADITVNENVLKADGTLAEGDFRAWFPIGYFHDRDGDGSEESICYNGTFDGQGYTISGLYFDNAEQGYVGLFGQTESGAEICNVTVADSYFKGKNVVGGVCGYNSGTITNSTNSGSVTGECYVGGVCGYNYGTITNSTNSGSVEGGADFVGGVCGCNDSATITNSTNSGSVTGEYYVGGVCGYNDSGTITNSTNSGSVTGEYYVGGVCGYNSSGTITNSTNSGSVEGGADFVGGVCGYNDSGTITNSTNSGSVTAEYYVGGVCGFNYGTITNSTNSGSVAGEYSIGGVCSYNSDGTVTNCYYDSDVFTGDAIGSDSGTTTNAFGKTTAEFQSGEVAYLLSQGCTIDPDASVEGDEVSYSGEIWGQTIGEDTYPVLGGDKVYQCESECSGTFYSNTEGDAQAHAYVNGFCTNTDCEDFYQPASDTNDDGVYEIANAGQLYWFMELVNSVELDENGKGYADYDAILTANITVNENVLKADSTLNGDGSNFRAWFPIGYCYDRDGDSSIEDVYYNGAFDGQGYTISGLYFDNTAQEYVGLFGQIDSGAEICNVTVEDSYFKGSNYVSGVCGCNFGMIINSTNSGSVEGAKYVGGVCGCNYEGTITNSTNSGSVTGTDNVGGVCGYNYFGTITNSTNSGSVNGSNYVGGVCGVNYVGTIVNCYYDSNVFIGEAVGNDSSTTTNALGKTTEEFKSGEVAYLLQSAQTETDEEGNILHIWGQTLGEDTYPVLGGDEVYQCESKCGGTFYSNNENDTKEHLYDDNGFCTNADCKYPYQPATDTDGNGVYEIANAGQLYRFMEYVNTGKSEADAILTADITINENVLNADGTLNGDGSNFREWFPIGYYYDRDGDGSEESICYNGTFDGQGYTISGLYFDNAEQSFVGLFGQTKSGAEICNVTVEDSYFKGKNHVGGVCGYSYGTITNCTNSGSVNGSDYVGGVCSYNSSGTITNSTNSGSVTGTSHVGGVCGLNPSSSTITNSTNSGSVTGEYYVGGVCGYNSSSGTITNSTNSGSVTGESEVGGVCGNNYGTITNCYYDSTVFTGDAVGYEDGTIIDVLGKTTEEFKSGEVAYLLQSAQTETDEEGNILHVWGQPIGEDTYPVLGGDKVYEHTSDCGGTFYSNTENDTKSHAFDANGFCTNADCEDPYQTGTDTDENGVYEIANAGQLYWFMELVNSVELEGAEIGYADYDAILTDDITVNKNVLNADGTLNGDGSNFRAWFPIGYYYDRDSDNSKEDVYYSGMFDGQGHTISGLYFDNTGQSYVGLFGKIYTDAEICNVIVADSYFNAQGWVGSICGGNSGTIRNCTNSGSVEGTDYVGGVCGCNSGMIINSTNNGTVSGGYEVGGVCGSSDGTITNCYFDSDVFTGSAVGTDSGTTTDTLGKTTAEFKTGEVAYLLQSAQTETDEEGNILHVWGQTIGEDTYPVLNGKKVFLCGTKYVNAHLDPCECTPIDAELSKADGFVATYTYGDTIDITAENFTTLSDPKEIEFTWQDADGNSLKEAPVNTGSYKLVVSIPQTYYNDILYEEDALTIDITIEKAALEASNFTFTAPENLTYDGSEKTATLTSNLDGIGEMTLTYYDENGEMLDGAPVNTGTYTVKADVAEGMNYQVASTIADENWTFTIGKADLTKADLIVIGSQYQVYDKNGNLFTVLLDDTIIGAGELTVTYADANGEPVDSINGAGTYTVTAAVSEGENHNAASFDWTVTIYKSLLTGITVDVTAPEAAEVPQSTVEAGEGYTASIKWIPAEDAFGYNAAYTAEVTLTPDANHQFTDKSEITAEDFDITRNEDGTITLTRTYDATVKAKITDLTAPQDVLLEEHQPDAEAVIALLPTSVLIESENGTTELPITWTFDGDEYDITANAEHTFTWTADCGDLDENGFDMTGQITVTNPDYTDISEQIELTVKDITYGMEPDVSAGYGENDAEITYSMDGETFDTLDAFLNENDVLSAGTYTVKAYYESETEMGSVTAEFTVNKAVPSYEIPTDLTATYGDTLADVELPESFKWEDAAQSVGNAGTNTFTVTFTPADTDNYEIIEGIEVEVEVAKAVPEVTPMIPEGEYFVGDALPEIGFNSAIGGLIQWITQLVDGLTQGENELEWQFTPEDKENYEVVTGTAVVEAQTTTTTTTTTSETTTTTTTTTSETTTTTTTEPTTSTTTSTSMETTTSSTTTSTNTETTTSSTTTSTSTETTTSSTTTSTSTESTTSSTTTSTNTETTTSSTTTSTNTETTTSSTTTSTSTETATSSTTTSTNTETTTSSTTTSTSTETTTSSTTTSTNTETTTSSTTTSTNTETTTSSTTTSTSSETTTSSTTTSTNTETTTSSTTTSTNTESTTSSTTTSTNTETTTSSTTTSTNTETTTSSTTTSTSTETTTSSTTTSTSTETTTSSTTTSTSTETTTSSTTTSTSTETTTSSTTTSTSTEPTTSSTTTSTNTTPTHIASDEELCDWAVNDYAEKTGVTPEQAEIEYTADGSAVITLTDAEGNVLDVYNIDPFTGVGTESDGDEVNLPQTGYGMVYNYIMFAAAAMVLFGIYAMAKSRKREEE